MKTLDLEKYGVSIINYPDTIVVEGGSQISYDLGNRVGYATGIIVGTILFGGTAIAYELTKGKLLDLIK
ncbi:hypothetical protein [Runella sp.]|uniref:hypothetical protein n=1 Tax=Runella sp. TaxID=1960881 RepID=UPI003D10E168